MKIEDFNKPKNHPFGMLNGYEHAYEKGSVLSYMLAQCYHKNNLNAVIQTTYDHPTMVKDGLLKKVADREYKLTAKAKGLLYSFYGKKSLDKSK